MTHKHRKITAWDSQDILKVIRVSSQVCNLIMRDVMTLWCASQGSNEWESWDLKKISNEGQV